MWNIYLDAVSYQQNFSVTPGYKGHKPKTKSTLRVQISDKAAHYHKQTNTTENIISLLER